MGTFSPYPLLSPPVAGMEQGGDFPTGSRGCAWLPELRACGMLRETLPSAAQHDACSTGTPRHRHRTGTCRGAGHLLWGASPAPQWCGASEQAGVNGSGEPLSRLRLSPAANCCPAVLHSLEKKPGFMPRLPRFLPAAVSPASGCSFRDRFFQSLGPGCRARRCRVAAIRAPAAPFPQMPPNLQLSRISLRFPVLCEGASSPTRGDLIIQGSPLDIRGENVQVFVLGGARNK